jgi:hypothetical protein
LKEIKIKELFVLILPSPLKKELAADLNINDPFFDYFKEKYPLFEQWLYKCSNEKRECWVFYENQKSIGALLIPKIEDEPIDSIPPLPKKKRLKICLFKVQSIGNRIGELFIKCATKLAFDENLSEIYLTHFTEKNDKLIELVSEYGFRKEAIYKRSNGNEELFLKSVFLKGQNIDELSQIDIAKQYYPCFDDREATRKFIIPIRPEYHDRLFTDCPTNHYPDKKIYQRTLEEFFEVGTRYQLIVEGNTIKKAYLCHSNSRRIRKGDIILFYRSKDLKSITSLGIVESIKVGITDFEEIFKEVKNRTAYSKEKIKVIAEKPTTVILFTHQTYFDKGLDIKYLKSIKVAPPMSITEIDHEKYEKLKEVGKLDKRLTTN